MINISTVDGFLGKQGRFCLIDWLLADNFLSYTDYEAWRYGNIQYLDEVIQCEPQELQGLLNDTDKYCRELALVAESGDYFSWDSHQPGLLIASRNEQCNLRLLQHWQRTQDLPQLDLFMDNSAQIAESQLLEIISSRRFETAQLQLDHLVELNPEAGHLGAYQDLINYGLHLLSNPEIHHQTLSHEIQGLRQEVVPLAHETLGLTARDYLAFAWRHIANCMDGLIFNPDQPELHMTTALLQIPDHAAVVASIENEPGAYRQPQLLERLAQSYDRLHQQEKTMIVFFLLVELDIDYAEMALHRCQSQQLQTLWQDFQEYDEKCYVGFFPAFVLLMRPGLLHLLPGYPDLQHPASQAAQELLRNHQSSKDEIPARQALQTISPTLLKVFLARCTG
ncbi:MAG: hypothetical protein GY820_45800 [Gammaproteobacteria bacterium]|nr:hypothetical protein [Gammaproteobacteria bacterium]